MVEEACNGTSELVKSGKTLAHRNGMDRVPGQTRNGVSDLGESMLFRTMMSTCMIRLSRISSICPKETFSVLY